MKEELFKYPLFYLPLKSIHWCKLKRTVIKDNNHLSINIHLLNNNFHRLDNNMVIKNQIDNHIKDNNQIYINYKDSSIEDKNNK